MHSEPSSILMGQLEFAGARMRGSGSKFVLRSRAFSDISRRNMATLSGISSRCEKRERERVRAKSGGVFDLRVRAGWTFISPG